MGCHGGSDQSNCSRRPASQIAPLDEGVIEICKTDNANGREGMSCRLVISYPQQCGARDTDSAKRPSSSVHRDTQWKSTLLPIQPGLSRYFYHPRALHTEQQTLPVGPSRDHQRRSAHSAARARVCPTSDMPGSQTDIAFCAGIQGDLCVYFSTVEPRSSPWRISQVPSGVSE